jgi:hypothetical protein
MKNIQNKQSFRDWLKEAVDSGKSSSYRADPIITSTDSAVIEKTVFPGIDVLTSPAEAFLRSLGVTFFVGLTGNFIVPSMAEDTGVFYGEDVSAASASMATASLTLAPRRVSHSQAISKETLAQTSPGVYSGIVQNLVNGLWNCVTNDLFDNVRVDCTSTNEKRLGTYPTWTDLVNMEASLGGKFLGSPAYVITPSMRSYLTTTAKMTNQGPIYENSKINSYPAYAVPAQNANVISFGDWNRSCVGQWGPIEIVVDPYTDAKKGLVNLTIVGLFDTGVYNKRGIVNFIDASTA